MLNDSHDAPVGHIPYQDLPIFGYAAGKKQAVVVREVHEGHAMVVLRQSEDQGSLLETPDYNVGIVPALPRGNISAAQKGVLKGE